MPRYVVAGEEGPSHRRRFRVECRLDDGLVTSGEGYSKKTAQQEAARAALAKVQVGLRSRACRARDATLGPPDVCSFEAKAGGSRIRHAVGLETMDRPTSRVGRRLRRGGDWRVLGPAAAFSPPSDRRRPRRRGLAAARRVPGGRDDAEPRAAGAGGPLRRSPLVQAAPVAARLDHDDDRRQPPAAPDPRLHALQPADRRAGTHHLRRAAREGRLGDGRRPRAATSPSWRCGPRTPRRPCAD